MIKEYKMFMNIIKQNTFKVKKWNIRICDQENPRNNNTFKYKEFNITGLEVSKENKISVISKEGYLWIIEFFNIKYIILSKSVYLINFLFNDRYITLVCEYRKPLLSKKNEAIKNYKLRKKIKLINYILI